MLDDATNVDRQAPLEADICIVGGGPAGITIAREFIGTPYRVILLESGAREIEAETQQLYKGTNIGRAYYDLDACRLRYFGGTSNHWAGWCRPLSPIDFRKRAGIAHTGWPIAYGDIAPFFPRAEKIVQLPAPGFDYDALLHGFPRSTAFPFDPAVLVGDSYQFSPPTRFGERYGPELFKAPNVFVLFHANVVGIQADPGNRVVRSVRYATLGGKPRYVRARTFVLATGAIENARLLLATNIGNQHDLVGRFFMEHPEPWGGWFMVIDQYDQRWVPFLSGYGQPDTAYQPLGCIVLSPEVQEREQILGANLGFRLKSVATEGWLALRRLLGRGVAASEEITFAENLRRVVADFDDIARRVRKGKPIVQLIRIDVRGQQAPNPDSRVTLAQERDPLGMPQVKLDWRLTDFDRHCIDRTLHIVAQEFGRLGLGRMKIDLTDWGRDFYYGNHHMGTTRMSDDPKAGVVDANCRVHGVSNLYMAGSSVFPTSGNAPPTLTIVALALRLADHLKAVQPV